MSFTSSLAEGVIFFEKAWILHVAKQVMRELNACDFFVAFLSRGRGNSLL